MMKGGHAMKTTPTTPATMSRARYLQIRHDVLAVVEMSRVTDVEGFLAQARGALASGPAVAPLFWAQGEASLRADIASAELVLAMKKGAGP